MVMLMTASVTVVEMCKHQYRKLGIEYKLLSNIEYNLLV